MKKLYVIVRKDLTPSQRAVQAGHAVAEFLLRGPNFYLGVKGLKQLENIKRKLDFNGVTYVEFREPDIGNEITAIASEKQSKIFERLNLL